MLLILIIIFLYNVEVLHKWNLQKKENQSQVFSKYSIKNSINLPLYSSTSAAATTANPIKTTKIMTRPFIVNTK